MRRLDGCASFFYHGVRKVRTPRAEVLGNAQAERSDTGATENIPPMDGKGISITGKGEMAR